MKLAVVGSRGFKDYELLQSELRKIVGIEQIISGGARGADKLAERYANENNIPILVFLPDYEQFSGSYAPLERNNRIVKNSDELIAFWDGKSKGTADAIKLAENVGIKVTKVMFDVK